MTEKYVNVTLEQSIATVEIQHPPANALSSGCIDELRKTFRNLAGEEKAKAIILTGSGRFFVAGADIKEFVHAFDHEKKSYAMAEAGQALCDEIEAMNKPVIAAINGPALGGGLEVALSCHYRIASQTAILGLPELKLGLIPSFGGTQRLTEIIGTAKALDMILSSKQLSVEEAAELCLVQTIAEPDELYQTAHTLAASWIDGKSMTSVTRALECIIQGSQETRENGLQRERQKFSELFCTEDAKEGVQAFIDKRKPEFIHG
ncbi:short chain enoyl-CoA hydratase [Halobacillus karajensis]|uniref:enoyl-CoA hydratase-related protein n=1 Tax=Halobacillus karajensis TaxID=195088 RepID=UPI0008A8152E|nr:enoyl-CoA hydratase-related protein [Halobacillus karajensis]SEH87051.1 short chain enoyl-CoA hydratase [Halobacillus karajensis]